MSSYGVLLDKAHNDGDLFARLSGLSKLCGDVEVSIVASGIAAGLIALEQLMLNKGPAMLVPDMRSLVEAPC